MNQQIEEPVVVLGASDKPDRYSNMALKQLKEHGYQVIPVHPSLKQIGGVDVVNALSQIDQPVHTITVYLGPSKVDAITEEIVGLKHSRIILNPGTENPELEERLNQEKIPFVKGCTLLMLSTGQF